MTTINGIPAHALLIHAIVVLAPLVALLEILCAFWPAARRRLVWLVLAPRSGQPRAHTVDARPGSGCTTSRYDSPILRPTRERGEWMIYFSTAC